MSSELSPGKMPPARLLIYLVVSRFCGSGLARSEKEKYNDLLNSGSSYLKLKEKDTEALHSWKHKLSGSTQESFHASGKKDRLQNRLQTQIVDLVQEIQSTFKAIEIDWSCSTEVLKSHANSEALTDQLSLTSSLQSQENANGGLSAKIYCLDDEHLSKLDNCLLELGEAKVALEVIDVVSKVLDESENNRYIFKYPKYAQSLREAQLQVWRNPNIQGGATDMARFIKENYFIPAYGSSEEERERLLTNARETYYNWEKNGLPTQ